MEFECGEHFRGGHVPAFGSWDWNDDVPFTECFETARQAGVIRYSYDIDQDRDLYVDGDLYDNHVVTPAMIVVPRRRAKVGHEPRVKGGIKEHNWKARDSDASPLPSSPTPARVRRPTPKPVDEDLYRISPELLYSKTKKTVGWSCFSSCFLPTRVS